MTSSSLKARLFVEQNLVADDPLTLPKGPSHYLRSVLRLHEGDRIGLFNGVHGEWETEITTIRKREIEVCVKSCIRNQCSPPDIWLVFAPIKRLRIDFIAQKATELGASMLWPVFTEHTAVGRINLERLRSNAIEAAEQSDRLTVPEIGEPTEFEDLLKKWPEERFLFCCDETGGGKPILQEFQKHTGPCGLLIGPEGGFSNSELDQLDKLSNVCRVSLGGRVLRSDTAAFAALACWQASVGDWNIPSEQIIEYGC